MAYYTEADYEEIFECESCGTCLVLTDKLTGETHEKIIWACPACFANYIFLPKENKLSRFCV